MKRIFHYTLEHARGDAEALLFAGVYGVPIGPQGAVMARLNRYRRWKWVLH